LILNFKKRGWKQIFKHKYRQVNQSDQIAKNCGGKWNCNQILDYEEPAGFENRYPCTQTATVSLASGSITGIKASQPELSDFLFDLIC